MSNHSRDYDKIVALLKSITAPCEDHEEHRWSRCRHCLAIFELEYPEIREKLKAFILAVEVMDRDYGKIKSDYNSGT